MFSNNVEGCRDGSAWDGGTCVVLYIACTLPSIYLVCMVFWHCHQHSPLKTQIKNIPKNLYIHSHELVKLYGHDGYWVSTARSLIKLPEFLLLIIYRAKCF